MRDLWRLAGSWVLVLLAALAAAGVLGRYGWNVVAFGLLYAVLATSWSWMRATGLFSLGQAAFFGTGALAEGWLVAGLHLPTGLALSLAALAGAAVAIPLLPALRLRPPSFALVTLAYAVLLKGVAGNLPGGPEGFLLPATVGFSG
jgi:branched-chain amino acid transport system permease protein